MFRKLSCLLFASAVFVGLNAAPAKAAPIVFFNDVTAESSTSSVNPVVGADYVGPTSVASAFTSLAAGSVSDIDVIMNWRGLGGTTGGFTIQVYDGSASTGPSTLLFTSSVYTATAVYGNPGTPIDVAVTGLTLTQGDNYFVAVSASDPNSDIDWDQSAVHTGTPGAATGYSYQYFPPGTPSCAPNCGWLSLSTGGYLGAFEVLGPDNTPSPVPEPSSLLLLGTGLVGVVGALRRKLMI